MILNYSYRIPVLLFGGFCFLSEGSSSCSVPFSGDCGSLLYSYVITRNKQSQSRLLLA